MWEQCTLRLGKKASSKHQQGVAIPLMALHHNSTLTDRPRILRRTFVPVHGVSVLKIVSGGQTGADRAALDFAIDEKIDHGGWVPAGRRAEDGPLAAHWAA